eukprot:403357034
MFDSSLNQRLPKPLNSHQNFTDDDEDDDFMQAQQAIREHRANIARLNQKLGLNLNNKDEEGDDKPVRLNDNSSSNSFISKSENSFNQQMKLNDIGKQMDMIEEFDTNKFKQKLHHISNTVAYEFEKKNQQNLDNKSNQQLPLDRDYMTFNQDKGIENKSQNGNTQQTLQNEQSEESYNLETIKKKYQKDLQQTDDQDWRKKVEIIKRQAGYSDSIKFKQDNQKQRGTQKTRDDKFRVSESTSDIKNILLKYSDNKQLNILEDLKSESSQIQDSFRSDLQPSETQSPRIGNYKRQNQLSPSQNEDQDIERIKQKYFGKNSPEQRKDQDLRRSSEQLFTETFTKNDYIKQSQDFINSSLDDLLNSFKSKLNKLNINQKEKESKNESMKHSPRIMIQALKESAGYQIQSQQDSSKKMPPLRKSQERAILPKSSENQSLLMDKFVKTDFSASKDQNQKVQQSNKQGIQQTVPKLNLNKQLEDEQELQNQEAQISLIQNIDQNVDASIQNFSLSDTFQDSVRMNEQQLQVDNSFAKPNSTNRSLASQKQMKREESPSENSSQISRGKKTTPQRSTQKQKLSLPKYEDAFYMKQLNQMDNESYMKDLKDIQDTLKTIKQMNLQNNQEQDNNQQNFKDLQRIDTNQIKFTSSPTQDQSSMIDNQEIDYNLSDDDEQSFRHDYSELKQIPIIRKSLPQGFEKLMASPEIEKLRQSQALQNLKDEYKQAQKYGDQDEDQISFISSSDQSSIYHFDQLQSQRKVNNWELKPNDKGSRNDIQGQIENKQNLEFRDAEIKLLLNIVPLAQSKVESSQTNSQIRADITQSLQKVSYLQERLKYLNSLKLQYQ